ncbi:MAG: HEAT repeat domain-containing protein, partial [Proteobacteria bacterium]|nr:HEAT repeat domain-containing protein [Pseudomonadota bacterium]
MARFRALKKELEIVLAQEDWETQILALGLDPEVLTSPLLALRLSKSEIVCWRAVEALGLVAARLADSRMEKARILMRTLMWYMNEESGNLGWGIPEAMASAMVRSERLAMEFHTILASYIYCDASCDGNYLDHPALRRGVFWGLGELARKRPELVEPAMRFLVAGCSDEDATNRGLAARAIGILAEGGRIIDDE